MKKWGTTPFFHFANTVFERAIPPWLMGRPQRTISSDSYYHVMNRGVAHRPVFERDVDHRVFRSLLAKGVRQFDVRVHAWTLLTNHFHLFVKTGRPELPAFMQFVESHYSQYFNETRDRDGPLLRGRYRAVAVEEEVHWWNVIRYIDANPVKAGISTDPYRYPNGSAFAYVHLSGRPIWMTRTAVEAVAAELAGTETYSPQSYLTAFGSMSEKAAHALEQHLEGRQATPLRSLIGSAPAGVRARFGEWTRHADGCAHSQLPVDSSDVIELIAEAHRGATLPPPRPAPRVDPWRALTVGMLRHSCGLTIHQVSEVIRMSATTVYRMTRWHEQMLASGGPYLQITIRILERARQRLTR